MIYLVNPQTRETRTAEREETARKAECAGFRRTSCAIWRSYHRHNDTRRQAQLKEKVVGDGA